MSGKQKVLIVDDSPVVVHWVEAALESEFEVVGLTSAVGFGAAIVREKPDLVLVDVRMPVLTGDDIVALARKNTAGRSTRVLLFSSLSPTELEARARSCGADGFIHKSGDAHKFARNIRSILRMPTPTPGGGMSTPPRRETPPPEPPDVRGAGRTKRVLIAEPCADLSKEPVFARQELGVVLAKSAQEVRARLETDKPTLLLLGQDLPDMGATQLARFIRDDQKLRQVSILFIGDEGDTERANRVKTAGVNAVLLRPFSQEKLLEHVSRLSNVAVRRAARLLVRVDVTLQQKETFQVGFTHNLSATGMLLEGDTSLNRGGRLGLRFFVPGNRAETVANGEIVRLHARLDERHLVGVRFLEIDESAQHAITSFVDGQG